MQRVHSLLFFVSLQLCNALLASNATTLTLGYAEFPPFTYTNEQGNADGIMLAKVEKIIGLAGYRVNTRALPTKRLMKYLVSGEVDVWLGINRPQDFKGHVLVSKQELGFVSLNIYSLTNQELTGLSDLNGQSVIIIRGYNYGGAIDHILDKNHKITTFITHSHESAFNMLAQRRANYLLAYQSPARVALQNLAIENLSIYNLSKLPIFLIVSRHTRDAEAVLNRLEKVLKTMK